MPPPALRPAREGPCIAGARPGAGLRQWPLPMQGASAPRASHPMAPRGPRRPGASPTCWDGGRAAHRGRGASGASRGWAHAGWEPARGHPSPARLSPTAPLRLAADLIRGPSDPPCLSRAGVSPAGEPGTHVTQAASAPRADRGGPGCRRRPDTGPEGQAGRVCSWRAPSPGPPLQPLPPRFAGHAAKRGGRRGAGPVPPRPPRDGPRGPQSVPVELVPLKEPAPGPRSRAQA